MPKTKRNKPGSRLRLKPADSFDLIRLLARSQYDPRKAVCELVQNSLDAQPHHVHITWFTEKRARAIRIWDDGEGVFPGLSREEALRRIATTIGHSHKRSLTPAQRRELMALGKYGIGLLGFWAVGQIMVIRSRVGGGETWRLRMREDSPDAQLERAPGRRRSRNRNRLGARNSRTRKPCFPRAPWPRSRSCRQEAGSHPAPPAR
jgi:hypothetical protein